MRAEIILVLFFTTNQVRGHSYCAQQRIDQKWEQYKIDYPPGELIKTPADEAFRKGLFVKQLAEIEEHNARFERGLESYDMASNHFSILTDEEMYPCTHCVIMTNSTNSTDSDIIEIEDNFRIGAGPIPDSVDWRKKGVINAVKNQFDNCASCWIFGSIASLEAAYAIQKNQKISLSEQQLVDCIKGCRGGFPSDAYDYIKNNGVGYTRDYPYVGKKSKYACRYDRKKTLTVAGYKQVAKNEEALKVAVATIGPVVVAIYTDKFFKYYNKKGVYYNPKCDKPSNHIVTVIGYGREKNTDYWLVRNSYGAKWGDGGYIKMARNRNNNCGIASYGIYPII